MRREIYEDGVLIEIQVIDDPPLSLPEQLNVIFSSLDENTQADLAPLKAAVKLELDQGRVNIARKIIERAAIPQELEPLRQGMLQTF